MENKLGAACRTAQEKLFYKLLPVSTVAGKAPLNRCK